MEILCGGCGRQVEVDDSLAGSRFRCEHCGRIIDVPPLDEEPAEAPGALRPIEAQDDLADDFLTKARLALKKKLLVVCEACGERLTVEQRLAGKLARCPSCGEQIRIPGSTEEIPAEPEELMADFEQAGDGLDVASRSLPQEGVPEPAAPPRVPPLRPRRGPVRPKRSAAPLVLALLAVAGATGLVGVLVGYLLGSGNEPGPAPRPVLDRPGSAALPEPAPPPLPAARQPGPPALPAPGPAPLPEPPPLPSGQTGPGQPAVAKLPPTPARSGPELKVVRARLGVLAADGLLPAPPGKAYLEVVARLSAGREPLKVNPSAGEVVVETDAGSFPAVGVAAGRGPLPLLLPSGTVAVPPTASRLETFIFLVPTELTGGKLKVAGVGQAELAGLDRLAAPPPGGLAGTYVERARLLRVAFDQPVMERLRSAGRGELVVRSAQKGLLVELRPADLRGSASPQPDGTYALKLADRSGSLSCLLRPADGGKRVVLYLDKAPYHQVVYEKQ